MAGGHHQELAALKIISVFREHGIELIDLGLQLSSWEPKEDDAGVGESSLEDKLAEIAVGDDQNPSLFPGDFKDVLIGETWGIVTRDGLDVMSKLAKVRNKSEVGALVEEEFHRAASERTPLGGLGETSLPVTISFA